MSGTLTRDDIIDGIRDLITRLRDAGSAATIQIVGGAAIALTVDGDREATVDVDGPITPLEEVEAVAHQIADERGWPEDWVNDKAKIFLPDGMGRGAEWVTSAAPRGSRTTRLLIDPAANHLTKAESRSETTESPSS